MLRVLLELARGSNLPTAWSNVLAAWFLAGGTWELRLLWMLLGASLVYSAGMFLNDAADATWDRQHKKDRPIPSGRISVSAVWALGLAGLAGGSCIMELLGHADATWVLALVGAVLAYDLYHKPWAGSVLVMGSCRTFLYVAAASGAGGPTVQVWKWGIVLGIYVVALSLVARGEAKGSLTAGMRWLLYLLLLSPLWAALSFTSVEWLIPAAALVLLLSVALKELRRGGPAIGNAVGWLLAGIPLVDALAVGSAHLPLMLGLTVLPPVLKLWQRWVAAT